MNTLRCAFLPLFTRPVVQIWSTAVHLLEIRVLSKYSTGTVRRVQILKFLMILYHCETVVHIWNIGGRED